MRPSFLFKGTAFINFHYFQQSLSKSMSIIRRFLNPLIHNSFIHNRFFHNRFLLNSFFLNCFSLKCSGLLSSSVLIRQSFRETRPLSFRNTTAAKTAHPFSTLGNKVLIRIWFKSLDKRLCEMCIEKFRQFQTIFLGVCTLYGEIFNKKNTFHTNVPCCKSTKIKLLFVK